jgi:hypothetical protein
VAPDAAPGERSGAGNSGNGTDRPKNGSAKLPRLRFGGRAAYRANHSSGNWYLGRFSRICRGESVRILSLIVWAELEGGCGVPEMRIQRPEPASSKCG